MRYLVTLDYVVVGVHATYEDACKQWDELSNKWYPECVDILEDYSNEEIILENY